MSLDSLKIWKSKIYKNYIHIFCLQSKCFVCIHKHYSVDAWKEFAAANEGILEVSLDYVVNYIAIDKTSIFKKLQTTFIEKNKKFFKVNLLTWCIVSFQLTILKCFQSLSCLYKYNILGNIIRWLWSSKIAVTNVVKWFALFDSTSRPAQGRGRGTWRSCVPLLRPSPTSSTSVWTLPTATRNILYNLYETSERHFPNTQLW